MKANLVWHFNNATDIGINEVPVNSKVVILDSDGSGTLREVIKISLGALTPTSTIQDFLDTHLMYKELEGSSELLKVVEGGKTGWAILNDIREYKVSIGEGALDFSFLEGSEPSGSEVTVGAKGDKSVAFGINTQSKGELSFVQGEDSLATGVASVAINAATANGAYSFASGQSQAEGLRSTSNGDYTRALGENSNSSGYNTVAAGKNSHAEGSNTRAISGEENHIIAINGYTIGLEDIGDFENATFITINQGNSYHDAKIMSIDSEADTITLDYLNENIVVGDNVYSNNSTSHAEGSRTVASGENSHAEGRSTISSGYGSHAEGRSTTASGYSSHAEGYNSTASGYSSHAEGGYCTSSAYNSHAEGYNSTASGYSSHAEGGYCTSSGDFSHAEGFKTKAINTGSHAAGKYNIGTATDTIHETGIGSDDTNRANAFEIYTDGTITAPESTVSLINSRGDKALATKEFVESISSSPMQENDFTATNGQTDFILSGSVKSYAKVYINGIRSKSNTFSISDDGTDTTVTLNNGAAENDWILIEA